MELINLSPQVADTTVFEGEGGGYYTWTAAKSPALAMAELAAGKLVLQPRGIALPHYTDSHKIGYVTQGTCTVGLISPNSPQEKVIIVIKGDAIPVAAGTISWWFNGGDSDATVIFLGQSSQCYNYNQGQFNNFFIMKGSPLGLLADFFDDSKLKLAKSQSSTNELIIVKLGPEKNMPSQSNCNIGEHVTNLENKIFFNARNMLFGGSNNNGVVRAKMTAGKFHLLEKIGLSASLVKLEYDTVISPYYSTESTHRIVYVTKGSGRVQIVGLNGTLSLDAVLEEDQLFVVPELFDVAQFADEDGLQFFCVSTSTSPR